MQPGPDDIAPTVAASTFVDPPHARAVLSQARRACRAQFAALGVMGGAWGVHIPSLKLRYELGEAALSVVLLSAAAGAVLSLLFAGRLVARLGARGALGVAAVAMTVVLALALQWPSWGWLLASMLVFGASQSLYDVTINAEGTALESLSRRALMGGLHGMFSLGGMVGAALAAAMLRAGVDPGVQLVVMAAGVAAVALVASRWMLPVQAPSSATTGSEPSHFAWPRGRLLLIGLLIFAGMTAEGVMYDWCVLYLKQELSMPQAQAGIGFAVFSGAMALARFGGDALRNRFDEQHLLAAGAATAATAMGAVLLIAHPAVALPGYALVGAGLALVVPILFNAATRVPGISRAAAIASVSSIGYSGFLIGPPLIGSVAQATSLSVAMGLVVVAAAALAVGARRIG